MSFENVILAQGLGKAYQIYRRPEDRLKQMILRSRRYFEEYWAVQNVDLAIARGETIGIIGRNGSGKSTLLQMIAGTLQPNAGTLEVKGRIAPLLELGAGFNPEFTGIENVRLAGSILGLTGEEIRDRENAIFDFAGIGDFISQPVKTFSSGMYARLAFAVAAHVDADILIVDEILAVGDASFTQKCMRFIREFREHGTVLFVSHETGAVSSLCDRAIWMDKGQVRAEGQAKDISFAYQAALRQETDGQGFSIAGRRREAPRREADARRELLKNSDKRNVMEVFAFDKSSLSFGVGGGQISDVQIRDRNGFPLSVLEGGEDVTIEVRCLAQVAMERPIVGFLVRDKRAQDLFGDNTYLTYSGDPVSLHEGEEFVARFSFQMPYLPSGDYAVAIALAEGTQASHTQHHWVDEALIFRCESSHVTHGLVGIPMEKIEL
jgi:lipopolysaccharide transport system ATP-binding protein